QFNELGINFSTDINDKLRIGIQLAARDLGDTGNDKVMIDWAYADYRWRDWLGLRVGKIKLPHGFYNKSRDIDLLRTNILLPQSVYSDSFREPLTSLKGVGGYGEIPLKALGNISYQVLFGTMNIDRDSTVAKAVEVRGGLKVERFDVKNIYAWAAIWETPLEGCRIGISRLHHRLETHTTLTGDLIISIPFPPYTLIAAEKGEAVTIDSPDLNFIVYSFEYTWKNLVLATEYFRSDLTLITRITGLEPSERKINSDGFYGSAVYRFSNWFEAGFYYSAFYNNRNDRDGTRTPYDPTFRAFQKDTALSLRFDLNDHWIFKLEGHLINGASSLFPQDNLNENGVPGFHKNWALLAAKMTFGF
ncbi:MAG: hypothetical protein GY940_03370, partial [bacterium]|nr:hypothetical protein [bacterium]